LGPPVFAGIT